MVLLLPGHEPDLTVTNQQQLYTVQCQVQHCIVTLPAWLCRDMVKKYGIKYFYDITDRADFRANPDYKGVCHIAMAQEGHCLPGKLSFSTLSA